MITFNIKAYMPVRNAFDSFNLMAAIALEIP